MVQRDERSDELRVAALNVHRILRRAALDADHRSESTRGPGRSKRPDNDRPAVVRS